MTGWQARIDVDAPHAHVAGDLTVSGFVTRRTAHEIAALFADALRQHYGPGTRIDLTTTREDTAR